MTSTPTTEEFRILKHQPRLVSKNSMYNIKHVGTQGKVFYLKKKKSTEKSTPVWASIVD